MFAVAPSQVGVNSKVESSKSGSVTSITVVEGQVLFKNVIHFQPPSGSLKSGSVKS